METITKLSPLALFYIMFSLGLQCRIYDFKKVVKNPKNLIIGLFSQMIVVPIIGLLIAYFAPVSLNYKIGIVLITCVPSTVTSNNLTKIAPSLGLMNVIKLDISFMKLSLLLFFISTAPILLGILINTKFRNFSKSINPFLSKSSMVVFVAVIFLAWYGDFEMSLKAYKELFWVLIMLISLVLIYINILVITLKIDAKDRKTIITETFIQNGAMAILVGSQIFELGNGYLFMAAIYGLFQYKLFLVWYLIDKKINKVV